MQMLIRFRHILVILILYSFSLVLVSKIHYILVILQSKCFLI